MNLEELQHSFLKYFLKKTSSKTASCDKMMVKAKGPVWHQKQKKQGLVPNRLHGLDYEATWSYSKADHWVYGHGSFCLVPHEVPVVGLFEWMPNSGHEAYRMKQEIIRQAEGLKTVCMDSKADSQKLYWELKEKHQIQLITRPGQGRNKSHSRKQMIADMLTQANKRIYKDRSTTVEPMQGLVKEIFDLERCWMRGNDNNRWLFAAMGVAVQIAQLKAWKEHRSTWKIKQEVVEL